MNDDSRINVRRQTLTEAVLTTRSSQRSADLRNHPIVKARVEMHLGAAEGILNEFRDTHQRVLDVTDFDPLAKTRQGAAWLLAGRSLSLAYTLLSTSRAGFTADMAPGARTLQEATGAIRIMLDPAEELLHRKWLKDGYFTPTDLRRAQERIEDRQAVAMLKSGFAPPGRTHDLDKALYDQWSKITHNRRSGIAESYSPELREFSYGTRVDPLRWAVWVGYATQVQVEVVLTVGALLTKIFGQNCWLELVEPSLARIADVQEKYPLDPVALGFPISL